MKKIILFLFVFVLTACSSTSSNMTTVAKQPVKVTKNDSCVPLWYADMSREDTAVGNAVGSSRATARSKATLQARANLAAQEKAQISQLLQNAITDGASINIDDFGSTTEQIVDAELKGSKVIAASECEPTDSNSKWESFVQMELDRDAVAKALEAELKALENAQKTAAAKEAYATLEDKVKEATQEIEEEKDKVSNLLNNMKQAIFCVNGDWNVIPPVSSFTDTCFSQDILGKDIFKTLYKDVDLASEDYANLFSAYSVIFGANSLQWEMVEDHLLSKINYNIFD